MRAALAMGAYDEARERGEKHSSAVRYAVDLVKQRDPDGHISETEVKRILAAWRPRGSQTILRFERKTLTEEDIQRRYSMHEQLATLQQTKGLKLEVPRNFNPRGSAVFTIRFADRPNYPRHNRKGR